MKIRIKNLTLKTIVGLNDWEQKEAQEVIINIELEFDGKKAAETDSLSSTVDYKQIKQRVLREVEQSRCLLLENLAQRVLSLVLADPKVISATVEVDKPKALRFVESVSVVCSGERAKQDTGIRGKKRIHRNRK
jgi:FolB domain-containing protein